MARKIIQIAVTPANDSEHRVTTVLCDDGTVWHYGNNDENKWEQLPPITDPMPPRRNDPLPAGDDLARYVK
jgi:hypothetical protein